jgi:hypothetical protein
MAKLPFFYPATAFERTVINFDSPTHRVPSQLLDGFIKGCNLAGGQEHPL